MQTSEREQFEDQWKDAFLGSEATPSDRVWLSVEGSLVSAQNNINKRRVIYYQRLAAALLLLCVTSVLIAYWQIDGSSSQTVADNTTQKSSVSGQDSTLNNSTHVREIVIAPSSNTPDETPGHGSDNNVARTRASNGYQPLKAKKNVIDQAPLTHSTETSYIISNGSTDATDSISSGDVLHTDANSTTQTATNENEKSRPLTEAEEKEIVKKMLADAGVVTEESTETKKIILKNPAWIAVGASGGSYATQADGPMAAPMADFLAKSNLSSVAPGAGYSQMASVSKPASIGTAYSFGFMLGKPLSKRWLLQAGLTYLNRRSDYESNIIANGDQVFYPQIVKSNISSSYSFTNPYAISNTTEFLSVPVQIGFVIVDKKIGWIINSGVSGDIFLNNTLVDKSGTYKLVEQSGDDTAYRSVSWSGLASTEVTLRLSEHYRFALVPGLRYSITNIVKDDSGYSKPLTLDIGFRFRYTF